MACKKDNKHLSVMFPPITLSLSYDDILFTTIDIFNIFEYMLSLSSFSFLYTLKLPSNILSQDKLPVVIVPVLSLNNIFYTSRCFLYLPFFY